MLVGASAVVGLGAIAAGAFALMRHPVGNRDVPEPAHQIDLKRYLGKWFEIGRYEQTFQKGMDGVSAEYSLRDDGLIRVDNRGRKPNGAESQSIGKAKVVDAATNAKLKVSFFGPFWGDYWVLDRDPNYRWAIVGEPSGRYLWLLHRDPTPGGADVAMLVDKAIAMGYDASMLRMTNQP